MNSGANEHDLYHSTDTTSEVRNHPAPPHPTPPYGGLSRGGGRPDPQKGKAGESQTPQEEGLRGRAEYQVAWVGHGGEAPRWQALSDIPPGSRYLANGINRRHLQEAHKQSTGAAATVAHSYVGKEIGKYFSHGAVIAGYVTE